MNEILERRDLVGKTIRYIYTSKWDEDDDGYAGCAVYVQLTDDVLFELQGVDFGEIAPIRRIDPKSARLIAADQRFVKQCRGRAIVEVLASDQWHAIGLLLSGDKLLIVSDDCTPRRVGPCVLDVGSIYAASDYTPYWSQAV